MDFEISKDVNAQDVKDVFRADTSDYHPPSYLEARLRDGMVFIAKKEDKPVGFLIYDIWWGNCPFIELIKIVEEEQRQGIGIALLKEAAKEIKNKNFKTLISSSEVINEMGHGFHRRWGFTDLNTLQLPHGEERFFSIELEALI